DSDARHHLHRARTNFGIDKDTSKSILVVPLLNPNFASMGSAKLCELRVRGTRSAAIAASFSGKFRQVGGPLAPFDATIVSPQYARRHRAHRPPGFGKRKHLLSAWARRQSECEPRRLLQREVTGWPGIGMAETGQ